MSRDIELLERLGATVAASLGEGPSEEIRILQRRDFLAVVTAEKRVSTAWAVAAAALMVIGAVAALSLSAPGVERLSFWVGVGEVAGQEGQWIRTVQEQVVPIRFEDGSEMSLGGSASARMVAATRDRVRLDLSEGRVHCDINNRQGTTWQVVAGPYTITVTGTVFDAAWRSKEGTLDVSVSKGSVLVSGADLSEHGVRLAKGDQLRVDDSRAVITQNGQPSHQEQEPSEARESSPPADSAPEGMDGASRVTDPTPSSKKRASPRRAVTNDALARGGEPSSMSLDELWQAAQNARFSGQADAAESMLAMLQGRFAGTRQARAATFLMGRIRLELRNDPSGAVSWFKQYLRESPEGPLAEEALGRVVDAYSKAGNAVQAKNYARRYIAKYPDGLFDGLAHAVLAD